MDFRCLSAWQHSLFRRVLRPLGGCVCLAAFLLKLRYLVFVFPDPIVVISLRMFEIQLGLVPSLLRGQGVLTSDRLLTYSTSAYTLTCPVPYTVAI